MRFGLPFSLLLFHCRTGARVALRSLSVPLSVVGGVGQFLDEGLWARVASLTFGPRVGLVALALPLVLFVLAAKGAAPRLRVGDAGWLRHLPASRVHHRIARTLGVAFAISPLVLAFAALAILERRGPPLLASWLTLGACTLVAAAAFAAPEQFRRQPRPLSAPSAAPSAQNASLRFDLEARITWRAVGLSGVFRALAPATPILSIAWFFATNNDLAPVYEARGALLAAGVATTVAMAILAERLAARRPIWGWARSLPRSAASRARRDALGFTILGIPITASVPILVPSSPDSMIAVSAVSAAVVLVPPLAAIAAAAVRGTPEARIGPSGEILAVGLLAAALVALLPALAVVFLVATPAFLALAAARERKARPSRFGALRHLSDGDPYALGVSR